MSQLNTCRRPRKFVCPYRPRCLVPFLLIFVYCQREEIGLLDLNLESIKMNVVIFLFEILIPLPPYLALSVPDLDTAFRLALKTRGVEQGNQDFLSELKSFSHLKNQEQVKESIIGFSFSFRGVVSTRQNP